MKREKLTTMAALGVAIAAFSVTSASALTSIQVQEIKQAVLGVPIPEMPAKAVELITNADKKDRQAVAVTAVRAAVQKHRAAAPIVISAVSKAAPDLASAVAVAASELIKEEAPMIARAAVISAPTHSSEVIAAVTQAVPSQASSIASVATPVVTRPAASSGTSSGGTVTTSGKTISGSNFPLNAPPKIANPVVIYNSPPSS